MGDYAPLKRRIVAAGLLRKQRLYYAMVITANLSALAVGVGLMLLLRHSWTVLVVAAVLGLVGGQLGFQLHDAGHMQMFRRTRTNLLVGFLTSDVLLGMSFSWWVSKHNRHHANPNHVDEDPDISPGALVYTRDHALTLRGPRRWLAAYQAFAFLPMISLLGFSMHFTGLQYLWPRRGVRKWLEIGVLASHLVLYVGLLVWLLGPLLGALVIIVHKGVGGAYMASVFAPNHKGRLQTDSDSALDFLRAQVLTARNVRGGFLSDLWYGSLNYQIEHHLFPSMPRNRLPQAQVIVKQYCAEIGVPYCEDTFWGSYREILGFLHEVGQPLRRGRPAAAG